jgi:membrane fusion protein (multidrug efflux system)
VSEGAVVTPQTDIALLKDDSKLKLECTVPERYAVQIAIGTQMSFRVRGGRMDKRYTATVYAMDPELDPLSRTLRLRATILESAGLIPGMFADVDLALTEVPDALLVPTESVVVDIKGPKVFVKRGAQAQEVRITSGTRTRSNVRVVHGLTAGDTVLTTGMLIMKDGMPVSVSVVAQANEDAP